MAKSEYFNRRGIKGTLSRWFFSAIGQLSVDRSGGKASASGLSTGLERAAGRGVARHLPRGNPLARWPAISRPHGSRAHGFGGRRTGDPVRHGEYRPVAAAWPLVPKVIRPEVRFGKPLDFSRYAGMEGDRLVLRAITDEIMYELMRLSGQQYVDIYATKAKEELKARGKQADRHDGDAPHIARSA